MKDLNISIVIALVKKNFTLKYKQTLLGFLWSLLHPAFFLLIFIAVFSSIFKTVENYPLYVLSGLVFFLYFSERSYRLQWAVGASIFTKRQDYEIGIHRDN